MSWCANITDRIEVNLLVFQLVWMVENVIDLRFIFSHKCLVFRFTTVTFKLSLPLATNNSCSESVRKLSKIRTQNNAIDLRKIMNNKTLPTVQ